jgi:hypothetical protein
MLYGCASDKKMLSDVPLVWKPTRDLYEAGTVTLTGALTQKYEITPFLDSRENKNEIAKNIEDNKVKLVTTCDNVADWCRTRFIAIFKQRGFTVTEENASVIIKGEVLQFYVIEDNFYTANIEIKITAENIAGKILWEGIMTGNAKRFGRSYKLENYYETISDAYLNAINSLLKNREFLDALVSCISNKPK